MGFMLLILGGLALMIHQIINDVDRSLINFFLITATVSFLIFGGFLMK